MKQISNKHRLYLLLHYFVGYLFIYPILMNLLSKLVLKSLHIDIRIASDFLFIVTFLVITLYLSADFIQSSFKDSLTKWKFILKKVVTNYFLTLVLLYFVNTAIALFTNQLNANNQMLLEEQFKIAPYNTLFLALVFAPLVEEIIFRGVIFGYFKSINKPFIAILSSSCLFGLMHILLSILTLDISDFIFVIPYIIQGYMITRTVDQTDNIWGGILFHFLNNFIAVLVLVGMG